MDVRTHHSRLLLPLCAAAYIQKYEGLAPVPLALQQRSASASRGAGGSSSRAPLSSSASMRRSSGSSGSAATSGAIHFLFALGAAQHEEGDDARLEQRIRNTMGFMQELGLAVSLEAYGAGLPCPPLLSDPAALCVCIFVLRTVRDAEHWLQRHSSSFALSNSILLVEGKVARARVSVQGLGGRQLWLNDFVYLDASRMARRGAEGCGAYAGFAPMLLDHIGSKIGTSYLAALRKRIRGGHGFE